MTIPFASHINILRERRLSITTKRSITITMRATPRSHLLFLSRPTKISKTQTHPHFLTLFTFSPQSLPPYLLGWKSWFPLGSLVLSLSRQLFSLSSSQSTLFSISLEGIGPLLQPLQKRLPFHWPWFHVRKTKLNAGINPESLSPPTIILPYRPETEFLTPFHKKRKGLLKHLSNTDNWGQSTSHNYVIDVSFLILPSLLPMVV